MSVYDNQTPEEIRTHPSYGQLSFSRSQRSGEARLYGSSIGHTNTIRMRVQHSELQRNLSKEWYFTRGEIIEIEMSQAQFAEAITSLNCGDGVPVTITRLRGETIEPCPWEDQREKFVRDFREDCREGTEALDKTLKRVEELFTSGKALNKKEREEVLELLGKAQRSYSDSIPFLAKQFNRAMDKTETEAKGEIEAFAMSRIQSIANGAIAANPNILTAKEPTAPQIEVKSVERECCGDCNYCMVKNGGDCQEGQNIDTLEG
jgi:TusA-related sulfurtransferase